jgi:hypothetical protein
VSDRLLVLLRRGQTERIIRRDVLPGAHRLDDVHAGMLTDGGARLQLATGPVVVPPHMRKVLRRQRTASILCNGPDDYPAPDPVRPVRHQGR